MTARKKAPPTPFATVAQAVADQGYKVIPVMPESKSPGTFSMGQWRPMLEWQQHRDRPLGLYDIKVWSGWEDANIGVVLGNQVAEGWEVGALDFDTDDYSLLELMESAVPESPVKKRGGRGFTGFYLMPTGTKGRRFKRNAATLCEILTGNGTRQTVIPPSMHPDTGRPYEWATRQTLATFGAIHLPRLTEDMLERFVDTLEHITGVTEAIGPAATGAIFEEGSPHNVLNTTALHRLADWVPQLGLAKLKRTSAGFVAIPHWRPNRKGWGDDKRNPSLAFSDRGIRDMSADTPHSPLDVVMMANGWDLDTSYMWLAQRLGMWVDDDGEWAELSTPKANQAVASLPPHDPETGEVFEETSGGVSSPPEVDDGDLTQIPGLLGDVVDWIVDTARQPNRVLALGAAITLIGTLMGRRVAGPTMSGTHLYVIALAPSGAGKDHALRSIGPLLRAANASHLLGPDDFMSLSAVYNVLKRKLVVCPMDEFGAFLGKVSHPRASSHEKGINKAFRSAWGSSFAAMTTPEYAGTPSEEIASPAFSVYGVSTPAEFFDALQGNDVVNGFLNRFLMISTDVAMKPRDPVSSRFAIPPDLREGLLRLYHSANANTPRENAGGFPDEFQPAIVMEWGPGAQIKFDETTEHLESFKGTELEPFYARTAEMAVRLATIRAGGFDVHGVITVDDIEWGVAVAMRSAQQMVEAASDNMSGNQHSANVNRILRFMKRKACAVSRRDIQTALKGELKVKELSEVLETLVEMEKIKQCKRAMPIAGKPPTTVSYMLV